MNKKIKIGLPKALLYYNYNQLWKEFFLQLGCDVIISPPTNKAILNQGINNSVDESCLSFKIFLGHVLWLKDKCDYILIPRIDSLSKNDKVCVKFNALPDIIKNTTQINILDYNIDVLKGKNERTAFIKMGKFLGASKSKSIKSYLFAKQLQDFCNLNQQITQLKKLKQFSPSPKVMIAGHAYNCCDTYIGKPIASYITRLGASVIYAHEILPPKTKNVSTNASTNANIKWYFNRTLLQSIQSYKQYVDGIILISAFPCGTDSLTNELLIRTLDIPICNLHIDHQDEQNGLQTRLESFLDILGAKKYAKPQ